jgi:hydrogenase-1 operon protein HyaE
MSDTKVQAPALLSQLVSRHQAQWVDGDNIETWRAQQQGDTVLLFAGDPVRFPEALDVAVVLPELQAHCAAKGQAFDIGVAVPEAAEALALTFGSNRWPTLMFFRQGQYVTVLPGMHDWADYVARVEESLAMSTRRAPSVGIAVVSANAPAAGCH